MAVETTQGEGMGIHLHHVSLIVADTQKSLDFYEQILGLPLDGSRPDLNFPGAWLKVGELQIHLLELPNPDPITDRPKYGGRDRHVAFTVDNLSIYQQRLDNVGITYTMSKSGRKALFCRDPDGNACELIERASISKHGKLNTLQFDHDSRQDEPTRHNLRTLYGVSHKPPVTLLCANDLIRLILRNYVLRERLIVEH